MKPQATNFPTRRSWTFERILHRTLQCATGICGLLLLMALLLVFGWLIFCCWLWDRRTAVPTEQPTL